MGNYTQIRKQNLWARKKKSKSGHNKEQRKKNYRVYRLDQTTDELQITVWLIISKSKGRFKGGASQWNVFYLNFCLNFEI